MTRSCLRAARLLLALWAIAGHAHAGTTPQALVREGHLAVDAYLAPTRHGIVPGQKLALILEIATDRWFSGGTRIALPEVPGLVILQTEQFASNASESRGGESWVVQRWTLDVYPQRAGRFTVPPLTAKVQVAAEAGEATGPVASNPVSFEVTLPSALDGVERWVAAPSFAVSQTFDRDLDNLQVGDAVQRDILFEASDLMAMMLPTFSAENLPGLAAYPEPPELTNNSNRGETVARRRQRISYVAQADGSYLLPAADFYWWDTAKGALQVVSLPSTTIAVGPGAVATAADRDHPLLTPRQWLAGATGVALAAALLWLLSKWLPRLPLGRLREILRRAWQWLQSLRRPALPERLNPGGSAGE